MAPKKRINKKTCKSKKDDCPVTDSCVQEAREQPPADALLASAKKYAAIVILPGGMKHEKEKVFYFYDENEIILFRGYALASDALKHLQEAVHGLIEYVPGKPCKALQDAGYHAMVCNDEGVYAFSKLFNSDAWAFSKNHVQLFGPVVLTKKM